MRPLLLVPLAFLTDLRAEESSWYAGGSFLVGQGEQKRTITTFEPPRTEPITPSVSPQPIPQTPSSPSTKPSPSPAPKPQEPEKPEAKPSPSPSQPSQPQSPNTQKEQQAKQDYEEAVKKYLDEKNQAIENAQKTPDWDKFNKYCETATKRFNEPLHNCWSMWGPHAKDYEQNYNRYFNEHDNPSAALPVQGCPIPQNYPNLPIPQGYTDESLMNQNCYSKGPLVFASLARLGMPNMTNSLYRLLANKSNQTTSSLVSVSSQKSQNSQPTITTSKETGVHYGGSLALGYKYFFKPRFGFRGYINIEYLYTNTYFSSSNILYGGGADFLANIIDNNDSSPIFGVFAGINIAGNTSITQIERQNVSNTKFDAFLHTGLRMVLNHTHEFNLGVRVPFIKNPSVSLKTKDKTYEVQNNMFYSLFVSYYYLF
ncbi:outer membrane beta-barrel protein [Helicobacter cetorum]|uniref:outer membrane beta-barrel protein n=1 Tax=Helicobacter cetorum TaxID=138563 RepID=UPI001F481BB3|nr:outer membrane beta-barrel protein [Helicobacter cetorum]